MIWGVEDSTVLGLAALVVGLVATVTSLWWNYKIRGLPYQQVLYQKQIEAYARILARIDKVLQPCYDFLRVHHNNLTAEDLMKIRLKIGELLQEHTIGIEGDMFLLPSEVIDPINNLRRILSELATNGTTEVGAESGARGGIFEVSMADSFEFLRYCHLRVLNTIRDEARIETLSELDWFVGPRRPKATLRG